MLSSIIKLSVNISCVIVNTLALYVSPSEVVANEYVPAAPFVVFNVAVPCAAEP